MDKECEFCSKSFTAQRSTARFCSTTCRVKASTARKNGENVVDLPQIVAETPRSSDLVETITRQLTDAGKIDTYAAQQCLVMARKMQNSVLDTGSATAALSKEIDRLMTALLADVEVEEDALDKIQGKVLQMRARRGA